VKCFCILPCIRIVRIRSQMRAKEQQTASLRGAEAQYIEHWLMSSVSTGQGLKAQEGRRLMMIASPPWRTVTTEMRKGPLTTAAHRAPSVFPSLWENGRRRAGGAGDGGVALRGNSGVHVQTATRALTPRFRSRFWQGRATCAAHVFSRPPNTGRLALSGTS